MHKKHRHPLSKKQKVQRLVALLLLKEFVFALLAVASTAALVWEIIDDPSDYQRQLIYYFEFGIALLFLADFIHEYHYAKHKKIFMKRNWYLLLACIPLTTEWAEALRSVRLLAIVRMFRAEEHFILAERIIKKDNPVRRIKTLLERG